MKDAGATVAYALIFGVLSGTCVALTPAMFGKCPSISASLEGSPASYIGTHTELFLAQITKDPTEFGTRFGIYLGLGGLLGLFGKFPHTVP